MVDDTIEQAESASEDLVVIIDDTADSAESSDIPAEEPLPAAEESSPAEISMESIEVEAEPEPEPELPNIEEFEMVLPTADEIELVMPEKESIETAMSESQDLVSVDFPEEEIRVIIREVAELFELNVVIPETLVGTTTLTLRNVTWRQVFENVLDPVGFTYQIDQNIVKIRSKEDLQLEQPQTRVFVIDFANASELQSSLAPLVGDGGRIQVDNRSNTLIITARPSRFTEIDSIIQALDRPTEQVMIESKFVEITNRDQKNLGINWASLEGYGLQAGPFLRQWDRERNSTDTSDTQLEGTRETLDGFNLSTGQPEGTDLTGRDDTFARDIIDIAQESRIDTAVFSADAFGVVLSALKSLSDVELISNPTVVTLNNTAATINIGEEFPIPEYQYNEERGGFEVSGFEFKPIGIILSVTPQVNRAGFINLQIKPEVSSRSGTVNFGGAGAAEIPIIATRKTESTITVKDGFTLAIGGLVERTANNSNTKVPVMGDIPGLGKLFRSKAENQDMRNLVIFITARTLAPDGATYKDVINDRVLERMSIKASDIPGYRIPEEERVLIEEVRAAREAAYSRERQAKLRQQIQALQSLEQAEVQKEMERAMRNEEKANRKSGSPRIVQ